MVLDMRTGRRHRRRGGTALEFAFFLPWYVFLFVGAFDWGFFSRALISTGNAARVATLYNAQMNRPTDSASACIYALREFRTATNIPSGLTTCDALPLVVSASQVTGPDGGPAAQVTVQYRTLNLIPIPGLLSGQYTFSVINRMKL
jgi:Flp pilus assembly protein TadG